MRLRGTKHLDDQKQPSFRGVWKQNETDVFDYKVKCIYVNTKITLWAIIGHKWKLRFCVLAVKEN